MSQARNREYYEAAAAGRDDYWRLMAAPRFRVATLLDALAERPPTTLVDLGCGAGQLLEAVVAAYPKTRAYGVDLSSMQVAANRSRLPGIEFVVGNLDQTQSFDGLEGQMDTVVSMEVIEHVGSVENFLGNARRLAVPGRGRLLLSTQSGPIRATEVAVGHVRHFTVAEMTAHLRRAGFRPDRVWNAGFPFHDLSKWAANLSPNRTMHRFSERPYGVFERATSAALRGLFRLNSSRAGAQLFAIATREA